MNDLAQEILQDIRNKQTFARDPRYKMDWAINKERRLGDVCQNNVLTVDLIWIHRDYRGKGVMTKVINEILFGDEALPYPVEFLHFVNAKPMGRLLSKFHFHKFHRGEATDYWIEVTGQRRLF